MNKGSTFTTRAGESREKAETVGTRKGLLFNRLNNTLNFNYGELLLIKVRKLGVGG
ncbi:hypothetical protein [Rodentibacter genomosp. 2]|uniref:hypothetical protein n=1 Tax=Rodentibacter genomosp. 2 TaxID=1908266 RepID=UPI0015C2DB59|nr:hypothetical protein [Rodentibacter genomosp. 2]